MSVITFLGRKVDRRGVLIGSQDFSGGNLIKSKPTNKDGETCIEYAKNLEPGDRIRFLPLPREAGVDDKGNKITEDWSTWRILSPYRGATVIPKNEGDNSRMEVLVVLPALDDSLMSLVRRGSAEKQVENSEEPVKSETLNATPKSQKKFLQIISLRKKSQAEVLVKALRDREYRACVEPVFISGKQMNRVLVEKHDEISLERLCRDMKVTFLPDGEFLCRHETRVTKDNAQGLLCN